MTRANDLRRMRLGDQVIADLFRRRHEHPFMRMAARQAVRDVRTLRRLTARIRPQPDVAQIVMNDREVCA